MALASTAIALALAHWTAHAAGDAAGRALGEGTSELLATLQPLPSEGSEDAAGPTPRELVELSGASPIEIPHGAVERVALPTVRAPATAAPEGVRGGNATTASVAPVLGILVRASAVRAAIARGGRPSGAALAASGDRPAGLVLSGVSSYGTALRDGDLLTRIGGTAATSEGRVIAAVSGAVRGRIHAIDGEIWRAGRRIPFVVELPRRKKRR